MNYEPDEACEKPPGPTVVVNNYGLRDPRLSALMAKTSAIQATLAEITVAIAEDRGRMVVLMTSIDVMAGKVASALAGVRRVEKQEHLEMKLIEELKAEVAAAASVQSSVITMLSNMAAQLQGALDNGSDDEIRDVISQIHAQKEALAAAVVANTPVANEPAPEPAPDPAPEPAPEPAPPEDTVAGGDAPAEDPQTFGRRR